MKCFKSWGFDLGLALIASAVAAVCVAPTQGVLLARTAWFSASAVETDLRLPLGLAAIGLIVAITAATRVKRSGAS